MKRVALIAVLLGTTPALGNFPVELWHEYVAGWGDGSFSWDTDGVTISTTGGSAVQYRIYDVTPGETYTLIGHAKQTPGATSYWVEVLLFEYTGQDLAAGDGIDAPAPDANIQLKSDGWGMNQDVLQGDGHDFDVNIWGYPNNPNASLDITPVGSQVVVALKAGGSGPNSVEFTGVDLIPEPTTLALIALGGVPLLVRRRRV
jgi:hypothetical protein